MADTVEELIAEGTLEPLSSGDRLREYHIPKLRHQSMTWMGGQSVTYLLTVKEQAEPGSRYTVSSGSDSSGDVLLNTDDFDEVDAWIRQRLEEREG